MPKAEQDDSRNMSLLFYQIRQIRGLQRLLVQRQMPLTQQKKFANHSLINLLGKKDNGIKRYQRYQNRSRDMVCFHQNTTDIFVRDPHFSGYDRRRMWMLPASMTHYIITQVIKNWIIG